MVATTGDNLRSLIFDVDDDGKASLSVLDQLLLPHETKYDPVKNVEDAWDAVRILLFCLVGAALSDCCRCCSCANVAVNSILNNIDSFDAHPRCGKFIFMVYTLILLCAAN